METTEAINYHRIAEAIDYIREHFKEQPNLDVLAEKLHLSPAHFQRIFTEWAGVSPKKFLQFTSIQYAKGLLKDRQATLFDTASETGLSGTGRLHDLFVTIEGMTPAEYKNGGEGLIINYTFVESLFGKLLVASTTKGVCYMAFADNETLAFDELQMLFPQAQYLEFLDDFQKSAVKVFTEDWTTLPKVKLHLKGTPFQLKVWETLLKVPMGKLTSYGSIAEQIQSPKASRAVGSAVGDNPIAFIIPCHRVIQSGGNIGQYHWGSTRKTAMIGWEAAKT